MEKQTVFVKRYPSKGELPEVEGMYITEKGSVSYNKTFDWIDQHNYTIKAPEWWLEEIELPSREESSKYVDKCMSSENQFKAVFKDGFTSCYNYILNKLKGEINERRI